MQLDDDAHLNDRVPAHSSADSPMCGLHRREVLSGRRYRPTTSAATKATPQFVSRSRTADIPPNAPDGPVALTADGTTAMSNTSDLGHPGTGTHNRVGAHRPRPAGRSNLVGHPEWTASAVPSTSAGVQSQPGDGMLPPTARVPSRATLSGPGRRGGKQETRGRRVFRRGRPRSQPSHQARGEGKRVRTESPVRADRGTAAPTPPRGWSDKWHMDNSLPAKGDKVAVVYSIVDQGGNTRTEWCLGNVQFNDNGQPVACLGNGWNASMPFELRSSPPESKTGGATEGEWC